MYLIFFIFKYDERNKYGVFLTVLNYIYRGKQVLHKVFVFFFYTKLCILPIFKYDDWNKSVVIISVLCYSKIFESIKYELLYLIFLIFSIMITEVNQLIVAAIDDGSTINSHLKSREFTSFQNMVKDLGGIYRVACPHCQINK